MATNLLKIHIHTSHTPTPSPQIPFPLTKTLFSSPFPAHHCHLTLVHKNRSSSLPWIRVRIRSSISSSNPPTSKESAILQARTCLSTTLEKPLNNITKLTNKVKRTKQPRFRVEIPVMDDSPESLSQLAYEVFGELPIKIKGSPVNISIIWPSVTYKEAALREFESHPSCPVDHVDFSSLTGVLSSVDVAVFLAPEATSLDSVKSATEQFYPRPVVIFNPRWSFEEESEFGELSSFVGSFEVVYSFMGLEVKGVLSKRKGVVFKCVRDGVVSGERWSVLVEEEDGELKVVSKFKARPSIGEVENVLYNLMAVNSPVTKSVRFLKDLVSNVTGKK